MANYLPRPVDTIIQHGKDIANRVPHPTYSMRDRTGPNSYDCSGFIGVINEIPGAPATPLMVSIYKFYGYIHLKFTGLANLRKGDILVYNQVGTSGFGSHGHTAMYAGNGMFLECHGLHSDGTQGPYYMPWHGDNWQDVLRNPRSGIYITHWTPTDGLGGGF